MKKLMILVALLLLCLLAACSNKAVGEVTTSTRDATEIFTVEPETETAAYDLPFKTRELSRDGAYKTMEMYVYDDNTSIECNHRITFEVPVEWEGRSSVIALQRENRDNILKVDMWNVQNVTRERLLNDFNEQVADDPDLIDHKIYSTEQYEIFYYKTLGEENPCIVYVYWFYASGKRFIMSGYNFTMEDTPANDAIFKRIAESVRF